MPSDSDFNADFAGLWWKAEDPYERARRVIATCDKLETRQLGRVQAILRNIELYEGRKLGKLTAGAYWGSTDLTTSAYDGVVVNLARELANTAIAQAGAKQRPKSQFVTNGADWDTKRRAKKLEQFCQAVKLQRQGPFLGDFWAVGLRFLLNVCVADSGWMKFWIDWANKQVRTTNVSPWEILGDPAEMQGGEPQNLFHVYPYDKYKLAAENPEFEDQIMATPTLDTYQQSLITYGSDAETTRLIKVREAWRLQFSSEQPGMWSMVIGGESGGVDLLSKGKARPWKRSFFPFETQCWEQWLLGIHGTSVVDQVRGLCQQLNASVQRCAEQEELASELYWMVPRGGNVNDEELGTNVIGRRVYFDGPTPPSLTVPSAISAATREWQKQLVSWGHDVTGINEQAATGQKQPGVESRVAIREVENIGSDRLGQQIQDYERVMSVGADRQIVAAMRELAEEVGDNELSVKWPGGKTFKELKWSKCSLEENQFLIQPMAVAGIWNTPADRKELGKELLDIGGITVETYKQILQFNDPEGEMAKENGILQWTDDCIEQWLDVDEEDVNDPKKFRFRGPPPKWVGVQGLTNFIVRVGQAYLEADRDDCPPWRLDFFLRAMKQAGAYVDELTAKQATAQAAAGGNTAAVQAIQPMAQAMPAPAPAPMPAPPGAAPPLPPQ